MTFGALPTGQALFIDANIFIYYFRPDPVLGPACEQLVQRIENQDLAGFTSSHVLSETAHRLMTDEASLRFGWPLTGIARRLRNHPAMLQQLSRFRQAIDEFGDGGRHRCGSGDTRSITPNSATRIGTL